jgi:hypothetical protein
VWERPLVGFTGVVPSVSHVHLRAGAVVAVIAALTTGCGSSATSAPAGTTHRSIRPKPKREPTNTPVSLRLERSLGPLPAPRTGAAAAVLGRIIVISSEQAPSSLPTPVHDAAAATLGNRLLLFGGGETEGTDQIVQV